MLDNVLFIDEYTILVLDNGFILYWKVEGDKRVLAHDLDAF